MKFRELFENDDKHSYMMLSRLQQDNDFPGFIKHEILHYQ